jgi:hypothetical protein
VTCNACGTPLGENDLFCGECGNQLVPVDPATAPQQLSSVAPAMNSSLSQHPHAYRAPRETSFAPRTVVPRVSTPSYSGGFFGHSMRRPPGPLSNATRYLCAAAYISSWFANTVTSELVGSHRAVAPSRGIDLEPIIRHCLKARRLQLIRDVILCVLLFLGLITAQLPLILILVAAFFFGLLPRATAKRRSFGHQLRTGAMAGVGVMIFALAVGLLILYLLSRSLFNSYDSPGGGLPVSSLGRSLGVVGVWWLIYAVLVAATLVRYSYVRNRTLGQWLSPGAQAPPFTRSTELVEARIDEVNSAQHGNLTLYGGEDPFIGAGITPFTLPTQEDRDWSIAIELNREGAPRNLFGSGPQGRARIDPVELHDVLRRRLLQLNDDGLPENERVTALTVDHYVVGGGQLRWDGPLIDQQKRIPFSEVSPEAIPALIRSPQAGLRYYQRVSVSDEGQVVLAGGLPVIGASDQGIVVSAFVYAAVEGHMFYLQFVPASLGPILDEYRAIDRLPKITSGKFLAKVAMDTARTAFRDLWHAPLGVVETWRQTRTERRSFAQELTHADDYVYADVGANISVRELGARALPRTYIQRLDINKYTQIIERLIIETVLDFLVAKGVDTAAYRASAQAIYNSGVVITGNSGNISNVNTGGGSVRQTTG